MEGGIVWVVCKESIKLVYGSEFGVHRERVKALSAAMAFSRS